MAEETRKQIFSKEELAGNQLVLPWNRTIQMCWRSLKNRRGRFLLIFVSIAVVVAFFVSNLSYGRIVNDLRLEEDVKVQAALEKAGVVSNEPGAEKKERDRMTWLLILSGMLCFVGVTNTMYMSVTERYREIGTLKCLGALNSFVIRLFMIESVFIGLVGSGMGALLGYLLSLLQVGLTLEFELLTLASVGASVITVPLALVGGTLLTVLAATYPTLVAARMKPVDAMRVEV